VNALANNQVADFLQQNCVSTYLKVGTFQIINGQKVGGNVASYFCLPDGSVLHVVPGKVDGATLLNEARWALEIHKFASTFSTNLVTGAKDHAKYQNWVRKAHLERLGDQFQDVAIKMPGLEARHYTLPRNLPANLSQQMQAHFLLATQPLVALDTIYPVVWERILQEKLSGLPVVKN
jgi:hypothetical protein